MRLWRVFIQEDRWHKLYLICIFNSYIIFNFRNTKLNEDDEFIKIADNESDEGIPQEIRLINYNRIISNIAISFPKKYDYDAAIEYKFEPADIGDRFFNI